MLNGHNATRRKTPPISRSVYFIENWNLGIAGTDEIGMKRMAHTAFIDRAVGSHQGLTDNLPAKHALPAGLRAMPAIKIAFDLFEI